MRRPIIVGNWKMHKTTAEAVALVKALHVSVAPIRDVDIGVAPPFTALMVVAEVLRDSAIFMVAQNMHWEPQGAYTGEIAAAMLTDVGCKRVIIGHSERRRYFAETDATVNRKIRAALSSQLDPILCIGETLEQREAHATFGVLEQQIRQGLAEIAAEGMSRVVIAYEPIWAIGTGRTASPAQAQEVHAFVRGLLGDLYGKALADEVRIQYGGSVNAGNIQTLMAQPDVDGALVGGASLEASSFAQIVSFQRR
ncbi:MAG TPA: triose-phosphate isomerase [Candidatus Tectomicrobia bacterium]|nr:triose-phosphate isomerase [Candidatus Tectomicrobia bacterium]